MSIYKKGDKFVVTVSEVNSSYEGQPQYSVENSNIRFCHSQLQDFDQIDTDCIKTLQDKAYDRGMNDAWETAKKLYLDEEDGGLPHLLFDQYFEGMDIEDVFMEMTPQHVKSVIDGIEEEHDFKVGDIVTIDSNGRCAVITYGTVSKEWWNLVDARGEVLRVSRNNMKKTGRSMDMFHILQQIEIGEEV